MLIFGGSAILENKISKNNRILDMFIRLCEGKIISKVAEAEKFGVDERSIQRDIDDIRAFLDEKQIADASDTRMIVYDRTKKGFRMSGAQASMMTNSEILAVSKILLESRAFTKKEIDIILNKLMEGCVPLKNRQLVSKMVGNEKYHYVELNHKSRIQDKLWEISEEIQEHNLIEITYNKKVASQETVKRVVQPVAVLFSEYYFYLNAYIVEKNDKNKYVRKYDNPAIFRIDRIQKYREIGEKFEIAYANRFEEGEFRKRVQFMFAGKLTKIQLRYSGSNVEAILDRLPTAKVIREERDSCVIEAEVYGRGIVMWLLSQGSMVEVIKPKVMRDEVKQILFETLNNYELSKE